ncbi:MAG: arsenate reductase ArsC [Dissulfurimicrobium sp.]|uniref:arsenate reductase ArsC n=1 Tax=Dissulfurimicrobium sp. TaxID=2022436 RepID=UPI00404AB0D6
MQNTIKKILFLCTQNACRSQMAEGIINHTFKGKVIAFSAGTAPAQVHPLAIKSLSEIGIDISDSRSKHIDEFKGQQFDLIVTLCSGAAETCPFVPGQGPRFHMGFDDPAKTIGSDEEKLNAFRLLRDEMRTKLVDFIKEWLEPKG